MKTITRLPSRPLRQPDIAALDGDQFRIVPYGGTFDSDEVRVYAVKIAANGTAHALGFDDSLERWRHLASVDAVDLAAADSRLDAVLDEWVQDNYGERFEVLKPR